MTRAATRRLDADRHAEGLAVAVVEALGDVAREFEVLALVVTDRDLLGLVEQDVRRHQDRVGQEADAVARSGAEDFSLKATMRVSSP